MKKQMLSFIKKFYRKDDATTAIEFALVAIPFMIMVFGVMEAGRLVWTMNGVQFAVEETARFASLNSDTAMDTLETYADDKLQEMAILPVELQLARSDFTTGGLNFVQLDGTYSYNTILNGFVPGGFGVLDLEVSVKKPVIN